MSASADGIVCAAVLSSNLGCRTKGNSIISIDIICDFDGTISTEDVTDGILSRFALSEWTEIEATWKAGLIGSRDCMRDQIALVEASRREIDDYLDSVPIDPHFPAFAAFCAESAIPLVVVSDGIDYAIHRILRRHGLDHLPVVANKFKFLSENRYALEFPHSTPACLSAAGTCKCQVARQTGLGRTADRSQAVLIGDGTSDFCIAQQADFTFAKDRLVTHCRIHGLPHVQFSDFEHARLLLIDYIHAQYMPLEAKQI